MVLALLVFLRSKIYKFGLRFKLEYEGHRLVNGKIQLETNIWCIRIYLLYWYVVSVVFLLVFYFGCLSIFSMPRVSNHTRGWQIRPPRLLLSCTSTVHKMIFLRLVGYNFPPPPFGKKLNKIIPPKNNLLLNNSLCDQRISYIGVIPFTANGKNFAILQLTINFFSIKWKI